MLLYNCQKEDIEMTVRELTLKVEREYGVNRYDVAEELTQYNMDDTLTNEEIDKEENE